VKRHEVKKGELYLKIGKYRKMSGKKEPKTSAPATGKEIAGKTSDDILADIDKNSTTRITAYFNDDDTFIRKAAYIAVGNIVRADDKKLIDVLNILDELFSHDDYHVRQTVINAAGEIGKQHVCETLWCTCLDRFRIKKDVWKPCFVISNNGKIKIWLKMR
jgi:hypothetical protein